MNYLHLVVVTVALAAGVNTAAVKRMSMERVSTSDLDTSASGYIYTAASGQPTSYVQFTSNAASHPVEQYQQHVVPVVQYYVSAEPEIVEAEPEELVLTEEINAAEEHGDHEDIQEEAVEDIDDKEEYSEGGNNDSGDGKEFEESGGEEYEKSRHAAHGENGDKGYENKHSFAKGEKGEHSKEHDQGFYKEKGGKKSGEHDSSGHYQKHHSAGKGEKGEKHGEEKSHKKGQKTTGFHNVYHKDEYKKDHTFYDEADNSGFYKKHGGEEQHHSKENAGHAKGGSHKSGYQADQFGKKGSHDKGHHDEADQGFKGQKGHEAHHATFEDFAKEGGKHAGSEQGFKHGDGGDKY